MTAPREESGERRRGRIARFFGVVGNRLLAGIAFAVPLVVTYWVLAFGYGLVTGLSDPWLKAFGVDFPGAGFLITIMAFIGLGLMAKHVIGRRVLDRFERFMLHIPVAGSIYSGAKQVLQTIQGVGANPKPKRPVVVEYLMPGSYLFGYATGHFTEAGSAREMTTVFVPTAPNPTTGLIIAVPSERVRACDISMEEATKMLVSGGLIMPARPLSVGPEGALEKIQTDV
ncbi:MAG: DUF502 domain-containing protein [Chthoniobacterales bacterium]